MSSDFNFLIPSGIDQNPYTHSRIPMDIIFQGFLMSLFQASQQMATISSYDSNIRFDSQLSLMNCQMFSTGFNSGALGGRGKIVIFDGIVSLSVVCQAARPTMSAP